MDSSSNRLFRFSKPEWLNNSAVRNGGVYVAGALVSIRSTLLHLHPRPGCRDTASSQPSIPNKKEMELNLTSTSNTFHLKENSKIPQYEKLTKPTRTIVRSRLLLPNRRRLILAQPAQRLGRAYQIRRLDPRYLLRARNAGYQLD